MKILSCICLLFFLGSLLACSSAHEVNVGENVQANYILSDKYANHRAQQNVFKSSAGDIAYTDHGQGKVLVLLHGVPSSSWMYRKLLPEWQKHFRVITIDFLGYGSSAKPKSSQENYSASNQADYVYQVLEHLNVKHFSLLFHDMGGLVAWEMLSNNVFKPRVDNIILLNTIISKQGFEHPNYKKGFIARQIANAYSSRLSSASVLEMTFMHMGLKDNITLSERECSGYVIPLREGSDQALYDFFTGFNEAFFMGLEQHIKALNTYNGGALILWGTEDKVLTSKQIPVLRQSLNVPEENIHLFHDNSHFLAEEIPLQVSQKVTDFLL